LVGPSRARRTCVDGGNTTFGKPSGGAPMVLELSRLPHCVLAGLPGRPAALGHTGGARSWETCLALACALRGLLTGRHDNDRRGRGLSAYTCELCDAFSMRGAHRLTDNYTHTTVSFPIALHAAPILHSVARTEHCLTQDDHHEQRPRCWPLPSWRSTAAWHPVWTTASPYVEGSCCVDLVFTF